MERGEVGEQGLGGVQGAKAVVRIYCMREEKNEKKDVLKRKIIPLSCSYMFILNKTLVRFYKCSTKQLRSYYKDSRTEQQPSKNT